MRQQFLDPQNSTATYLAVCNSTYVVIVTSKFCTKNPRVLHCLGYLWSGEEDSFPLNKPKCFIHCFTVFIHFIVVSIRNLGPWYIAPVRPFES